jgi:hypothetical protein
VTGGSDGIDPDVTELADRVVDGSLAFWLQDGLVEVKQRVGGQRRLLLNLALDRRRWDRNGCWRRGRRLNDAVPRIALGMIRANAVTQIPAFVAAVANRFVAAVLEMPGDRSADRPRLHRPFSRCGSAGTQGGYGSQRYSQLRERRNAHEKLPVL